MSTPRRHSDAFSDDEFGDFIIRRRILPIWQLLALFLISFSFLFVVTTNAEMLGGTFGIGLAILAVIGPLTWFTVYFSQQNRDMLLAAEFQNALFSAAARLKSKFVMIVKQDGTIFYYDRGFQEVFPDTANRGTLMVDKIFSNKQISPAESAKLQTALESGHHETVFVTLLNADGEEQKVIITVDPLPRPSGFYIVRGRDYVTKRKDRDTNAGASTGNATPLSATMAHMLQTVPYGLYTSDAEGRIQFINYRMENWLGFDAGEIHTRKLTLMDIISPQNTALMDDILQRDCAGTLVFKTKDAQGVQLYLQQEVTKDAQGAVIGSVGLLQPEHTGSAAVAPRTAVDTARQPESGTDLPPATGILTGNSNS